VAATAVTLVSALAVAETVNALRELSRDTQNEQLLLLQTFMGVTSVTILVSAVVAERRRGEKRPQEPPPPTRSPARQLPRAARALEAEMKRCSGRPAFALLFFDLDDLKRVNDRHAISWAVGPCVDRRPFGSAAGRSTLAYMAATNCRDPAGDRRGQGASASPARAWRRTRSTDVRERGPGIIPRR
jgi:hypothetical protein